MQSSILRAGVQWNIPVLSYFISVFSKSGFFGLPSFSGSSSTLVPPASPGSEVLEVGHVDRKGGNGTTLEWNKANPPTFQIDSNREIAQMIRMDYKRHHLPLTCANVVRSPFFSKVFSLFGLKAFRIEVTLAPATENENNMRIGVTIDNLRWVLP